MKRDYLIKMIITLLILSLFSGCMKDDIDGTVEKKEQEYNMLYEKVYINGETDEAMLVPFSSAGVRLPFIKIVQLLGMAVETKEDGVYHITKDNDVYVLHCAEVISLVKQGGDNSNIMNPPPGVSSFYCRYEGGDVYLDDETLAGALSLMGVTVHILVDHTLSKINIVTPQ